MWEYTTEIICQTKTRVGSREEVKENSLYWPLDLYDPKFWLLHFHSMSHTRQQWHSQKQSAFKVLRKCLTFKQKRELLSGPFTLTWIFQLRWKYSVEVDRSETCLHQQSYSVMWSEHAGFQILPKILSAGLDLYFIWFWLVALRNW